MKLVTFVVADAEAAIPVPGVVAETADTPHDRAPILDLLAGFRLLEAEAGRPSHLSAVIARYGGDMISLIERQDVALPAVKMLLDRQARGDLGEPPKGEGALLWPRERVRLLAPIPRPLSMRDGYAFRQHVEAARRNRGLPMIPEFDDIPIFYYTNHLSVVGPGPVRVRRRHLDQLDFELEAAVVTGRTLRDASVEEADAAIFGLMIMNDLSARALQMHEMKLNLGPAKGKDFATALGPYLVPCCALTSRMRKSAAGTQFDLRMTARHNGDPVAEGRLADMHWTFAQILARASYGVTLHPGEVIGSGTVGTGCFLETNGSKIFDNRWLRAGDVIDCEIDELGCLRNTIDADLSDRPEAP
jgi:fumarylacetoacetate (FAA) hydrolase